MDNTNVTKDSNVDLYKNQERYEKFLKKKDIVYRGLFDIASILAFISIFMFPIFYYCYKGNARISGDNPIYGDYTVMTIIQKIFAGDLGKNNLLNICLLISLIVAVIASVYLVAGAVISTIEKLANKQMTGIVKKIFNFGILEIVAVVLFIALLAAMIFCRVNLQGMAENSNGFWILTVSAIVMTCTSISLSYNK